MPAHEAKYQSTGTYDMEWDDFEVSEDIIVCHELREEVSKGGILIADAGDAQRVRWAKVIACGPGRIHDSGVFVAMRYQIGDVVMFGKYQTGGEPIMINGKECLMFRQGDLVGRIKPKVPPTLKVA